MLTNCLAVCTHLSITVSEIQRDICEKIVILSYPLAFDAPVRGFPSEYRHPLWYGKTRMVSLPDGEKILKISLFWRNSGTWRTDRQTDGRTTGDGYSRAMHSIARQKWWWWWWQTKSLTTSCSILAACSTSSGGPSRRIWSCSSVNSMWTCTFTATSTKLISSV